MNQDVTKRLITLAKSRRTEDEARRYFLDQIEKEYNMLLCKCYITHMAGKKSGCKERERIALLGTSNITPLKDMLKAVFHAQGVYAEDFYIGAYNNYMQELRSDKSKLYEFKPSITVIVLSIQDMLPDIYERPYAYSVEQGGRDPLAPLATNLQSALEIYNQNLQKSRVFITLLPSFENPCNYVYSPSIVYKGALLFLRIYRALSLDIEQHKNNIFLLDTDNLIHKFSANQIEDKRYWYLGRIRYSDTFFFEIAKEITSVYKMATQPSKKCLVVDLDNTLWGGIIGQDGIENIILGQDGLGKAYQDFQREILKLHDKGIMLAVCSKNNEADVEAVFDRHSEMILNKEHFVSVRINWDDKAKNIAEIAEEINIGLDSMVFFDDDPAQRRWVRVRLPQVEVPELPSDPFLYADFLKDSRWFNSYRLSKDDLSRNVSYRALAKSKKLRNTTKDFNAYLRSLNQQIILEDVNPSTISRAVQLSQKTNQFNMRTRRYQMPDIKGMMDNKDCALYTVRVKDCFCDHGIVGLIALKGLKGKKTVIIDEFLLSCRIIGRKIEAALLDRIKYMFKRKRFNHIEAWYEKTARNTVCSDVYPKNGFEDEGIRHGPNKTCYLYHFKNKIKPSGYDRFIKVKHVTPKNG